MNHVRDAISGLAVILDVIHHLIHLGRMFAVHGETVDATFDDGTNFDILVVTAGKAMHAFITAEVYGGRAELTVLKNVTATDGTAAEVYNVNGESAVALSSGVSITKAPTSISGGTAMYHRQIFGTATGVNKVASSLRTGEIVFPRNSKTLVRLTSRADNELAALDMEVYER